MDVFTLTGKILIDNTQADKSLSSTGEKSESLASKLGTKLSQAAQITGITLKDIGKAAVNMAKATIESSDECHRALNTLQTKTGATNEEMESLRESLLSIYGQNYGESFEDVANAMADIKQQTGLTGKELENFTINAMSLSDTFDMDVVESTRAADMMMKQFGMSGEEAYALIAQGAQSGLDKNGNLLDSINEYSVHFAQVGLDAEDMFNMFSNGAEAGIFDIDKLGDAVKEFGIRVKDGTGDNAFQQLGLDAEALKQKFAEGGEGAKQAFQEVNTALMECDDKVLQNQLGVELYGTMWEDSGAKTIEALANMNGEFDKTKQTMQEIQDIKYDSFGEAMQGIGRQIEVGLLVPLGDLLLPYLNEFANFINEHMPEIQAVFQSTLGVIGSIINGAATFIGSLINSIKSLSTSNNETCVKMRAAWEEVKSAIGNILSGISQLAQAFIAAFQAFWDAYGSYIMDSIENTWNIVKTVFGAAFDILIDLFNVFANLFSGNWSGLWDSIVKLFTDTWNGIKNIQQAMLNAIVSALTNIGSALMSAAKSAFECIKKGFMEVWESIKSWFSNAINAIAETITSIGSRLYEAGKSIISSLWNGLKDMWGSIESWFSDKVSWIADKLTFWNNSKAAMADGSHRSGLKYVPYDGYIAETHMGEAILTKEEADEWRNGGNNSKVLSYSMDTTGIENKLDKLINYVDKLPRRMQIEGGMA